MAKFETAQQTAINRAKSRPDRPFLHQPVGERVDTHSWLQCVDISQRAIIEFAPSPLYLFSVLLATVIHTG